MRVDISSIMCRLTRSKQTDSRKLHEENRKPHRKDVAADEKGRTEGKKEVSVDPEHRYSAMFTLFLRVNSTKQSPGKSSSSSREYTVNNQ